MSKPQKKITNLRNNPIIDELLASAEETDNLYPVDGEWMLLAEFGRAFGWQAYKDARDDKISAEEMMTLIEANRKQDASRELRATRAAFVGTLAANSKDPSKALRSLTKDLINQLKADV